MHLIIKLIANGWNKCVWSKLGRFPFQFDVFDYYVTHFIFQSVIFSQIVFIFIGMWFLLSTATDHSKSVKPFRIIFSTSFDLLLPVMPLFLFFCLFFILHGIVFLCFPIFLAFYFYSCRVKSHVFIFTYSDSQHSRGEHEWKLCTDLWEERKKLKKKLVKRKQRSEEKKIANKIIWEIKPQSHWANVFYTKHTEVWHNANGLCT